MQAGAVTPHLVGTMHNPGLGRVMAWERASKQEEVERQMLRATANLQIHALSTTYDLGDLPGYRAGTDGAHHITSLAPMSGPEVARADIGPRELARTDRS